MKALHDVVAKMRRVFGSSLVRGEPTSINIYVKSAEDLERQLKAEFGPAGEAAFERLREAANALDLSKFDEVK